MEESMNTQAGGHSAATLYEASKLPCACDPGLKAAWHGARVAGPAFTVRGIGGDNLALHNAVLAAPAGSVLVADMQGAAHGHWGEVLAVAAQHRGIAGLIIEGGVRDADEMAAMDFPVFSRSVTVVGTVKDYAGDLRSPVRIGGITVHTGDLIVGDADGVIVLPQHAVAETIARADQRVADERRILDEIRNGKTTLELYGLAPEGTFTTR
jgi:4-hydroxy-4-methyl-2-oxoglutarate aldolase